MSLRLGALHDALLDPGNAEKAHRAAEAMADYHKRIGLIETDITLLKWMVGGNLVFTLIALGTVITR